MPNRVAHSVPVRRLQKGDQVVDTGDRVVALEMKTKWAYVSFSNGDTQRVDPSQLVEVYRFEPTPEEEAAALACNSIRELRELLSKLLESPADWLRAKLDARAESAETWGTVLRAFDTDEFLRRQALWGVAIHVDAMRKRFLEGGASEDDALVRAWCSWAERPARGFDRGYIDPLNRSTSVMSNMYEDLEHWAVSDVKRDWRFPAAWLETQVDRFLTKD